MKSINRTFIIAGGLALSGVIIAGLAMASQSGHFGHHKHHKSFSAKSLDTDGDGMLARDELLAKNQRRFSKLDTDGDGSISPEEFSARLAKMFDRLDVNANGLLEPGEMPRRVKHHDGRGHHQNHQHRDHRHTTAIDATIIERPASGTSSPDYSVGLSAILIPSTQST